MGFISRFVKGSEKFSLGCRLQAYKAYPKITKVEARRLLNFCQKRKRPERKKVLKLKGKTQFFACYKARDNTVSQNNRTVTSCLHMQSMLPRQKPYSQFLE